MRHPNYPVKPPRVRARLKPLLQTIGHRARGDVLVTYGIEGRVTDQRWVKF